jgi:HK97 gp10 family phage protein
MTFQIDFDGLKALEKNINALSGVTRAKVFKKALRHAAKPVLDEMKAKLNANFDRDTGQLEDSLGIRVAVNKKGDPTKHDIAVFVGIQKQSKAKRSQYAEQKPTILPPALVGYWLETGVAPHDLNKKSKRGRGKVADGSKGHHGGITASPFIRPALINNEQQVINSARTALAREIQRILKT